MVAGVGGVPREENKNMVVVVVVVGGGGVPCAENGK